MDLIVGAGQKSAILVLVERSKNYVMLSKSDPYSAWQKGAVENMNKLIRQYLPKGTDFRTVSDEEIKQIQYKLNQRPREKLGFKTPKSEFFNSLL